MVSHPDGSLKSLDEGTQRTMSDAIPSPYYKGERLKSLRAFCQIARLGSVSRAAEALFVSQPAVSLQLKALEGSFGARLFERIGRRLNLTREGEILYELARPLVEQFDSLEDRFRSRVSGLSAGELHIAAGSSTILYLLPPLVRAFRAAFPDLRIEIRNVTGVDGMALVRSDAVDFAIATLLETPRDLDYTPLYRFDQVLITAPDHPLAHKTEIRLEDFSSHGLILPPRRPTTNRLVELVFRQHRVPYQVTLEVGGWEMVKQYVAMGLGISIVTRFCVTEADRERLVVRDLPGLFPARSYGVVSRKGKYLSVAACKFLDLVKPGFSPGCTAEDAAPPQP